MKEGKNKKILFILLISITSLFADTWTSGIVEIVGKHTFNGSNAMYIVFRLSGKTYAFKDDETATTKERYALLLSAVNSGATITFRGTTNGDPALHVHAPWFGGDACGAYQFYISKL
jgi:hypothetical protein